MGGPVSLAGQGRRRAWASMSAPWPTPASWRRWRPAVFAQFGDQLVEQHLLIAAWQVLDGDGNSRGVASFNVGGADEFQRALARLGTIGEVEQNVAGGIILLANGEVAVDAQKANRAWPHVSERVGNGLRGACPRGRWQ